MIKPQYYQVVETTENGTIAYMIKSDNPKTACEIAEKNGLNLIGMSLTPTGIDGIIE